MQYGSTIVTPQFLGLGDGSVPLQSITCNDGCSDNVFLNTLDDVGTKVDTYAWINYGGATFDQSFWTVDYENPVEGVSFQPGQALWVEGTDASQALMSAGQVGTDDVDVQLQYGSTMTGNCTPVEIDLQDILCGEGCSDNVFINTLDDVGTKIDTYAWINYGGKDGDQSFWTVDYENAVEGVKFAPGQGLWVEGTDSTQYITLPGVEL